MDRHRLRVLVTMRRPTNAVLRAKSKIAASGADERGIALQTVIIMVVLVMIGGAVAGVLVSRAGQETDRLENVDTTIDASKYGSETLCEMAGHTWSSGGACVPTTTAPPNSPDSAYLAANNDEAACGRLRPPGTWTASTDPSADPGDGTCAKPNPSP